MSLEEFFNDNSLGDSVWNEEDINLEAISSPLTNTTSIDVLKHTPIRLATRAPEDSFGYPHSGAPGGIAGSNQSMGPPYIVKFSHLPSQFTGPEIEDLFQTKCTKFIKFKLFWELNKKPAMGIALKNSSFFDANFTRDSKVTFTELYSARDMDKILNHWTQPLKELYDIVVTAADFADFKNYVEKTKLLNEADDPTKPFVPKKKPTGPPKAKANPFGTAKPTDTQAITNDIEEKYSKLHIEDTKTLRRLSNEGVSPTKPVVAPKPLSYSAILKRSVDAAASQSPSPQLPLPLPKEEVAVVQSNDEELDDAKEAPSAEVKKDDENHDDQSQSSDNFTFKDTAPRGHGGYRGRGAGRGGRGGRSDRSDRGDHSGERGSHRGRGGGRGGFSRDNESGRKYDDSRSRGGKFQSSRDDNPYSVFRPASGFLRENVNTNSPRGRGGRGHSSGGGRGRGGYRGDRRGFTAV
ncbi:LAME_0H11958g1_1 [Lachancea meyersii CBS 8951]|uniref:LAME_0H11958g1_1 n=1 Tax=Lachancea meyersii CBS 8951 TaxID=1266667 RepID=A0A1G4KGJ8_9SACH|nr:LAME_0H11958g1_1 [Lachancea meyersii CBS 8951]